MIGFRVDANEHIATGHLMRCMAIALECIKMGADCKFYLAEGKLTERLQAYRIPYQVLGTTWNDLESETELLCKQITADRLDWLVVDSYQATNTYLSKLNTVCKVMYVDDMAAEIYNVSALLHYSPWEEATRYEKLYEKSNIRVLSGTRYAPLREEFRSGKNEEIREKGILFTTGGTDPFNVTMSFLKHAQTSETLREYDFYIIVGNMNTFEKDIREYSNKNPRIHVLKNINNMSYYMKKCAYAVSAGGTTLFELCACKIPTVCISFADNQIDFAKKMDEKEVMLYAGDARYNPDIGEDIVKKIVQYIEDGELTRQRVENMACLVDGKGAIRVAQVLTQ